MTGAAADGGPLRVFLVVGEESGDQLGAGLMDGLQVRLAGNVRFEGVGGVRMTARGLAPLFPASDLAHNGVAAVVAHLPAILRRIRETVAAVLQSDPGVLVIIDSPDFNLRVARQVRARNPDIPIVAYVSPTVWAWRPGRARKMARFVDHLLALLPFEPEVHRALGGPPTTYVGHPLLDRLGTLRPAPGERPSLSTVRPTLLVLPGSRRSEITRLLSPFGEAVALVADRVGAVDVLLPAVAHLAADIRAGTATWRMAPQVVEGEEAKLAAFRRAHAALLASGTATLELGLAGVPMVVGYRLAAVERPLKAFIRTPSIVLTNLILGDKDIPEFLDADCVPEKLAEALAPLLADSPERAAQVAALARLDGLMQIAGSTPTDKAAETVLSVARARRPQRRFEIGT
jgi:lipid-A-disaccharide synthase